MWRYFNNNPLKKNIGDCVIRAISHATGKTWHDTFSDLCLYGNMMCDMPSSNAVWGAYLLDKGFFRSVIPNTCPDCYTVSDFAEDHKHGNYILATGTHVISVKDGIIYDSWDSSNEIPVYYFWKER